MSSQVADTADALYIAVAAASVDEAGRRSKIFHQDDLLSFAGVADAKSLMPLIQHLANHGLFRTLKVQGKLGWSVRPREAARQIVTLDRDEKLIYEVVEESHTNGVWSRDIRKKTNIAPNALTKALNKMEKSLLIKSVKSVKTPLQKIYMLHHLHPSEEVTGNSFFDAGDLDESFRDELMNLIVFWVRMQSWIDVKKKPHHRHETAVHPSAADDPDSAGKKRKRIEDIEDAGPPRPTKYRSLKFDPETDFPQLMHKAGSHEYPTAEDIHRYLTHSDAIKPTKARSLTVPEIQGCIDVLCWDEKLEKIPNKNGMAWGYRTVRGVVFKPPGTLEEYEEHVGTGLTQAPCGRCPVFDICSNTGPVNPQECVYFDRWLKA